MPPTLTSSLLTYGKNWLRTTRKSPCPICQRFGFCEISADTKTVHCMKIANDRPFDKRQGGWLHPHPLYFDFERASAAAPAPLTSKRTKPRPAQAADHEKLGELSPTPHGCQPSHAQTPKEHAQPGGEHEKATGGKLLSFPTPTGAPPQTALGQPLPSVHEHEKLNASDLAFEKAIAEALATLRAEPPTLHAVYSDFLAACTLNQEHASAIAAKRKLSLAQITAMGIKSIPQGDKQQEIIASLVTKYGASVLLSVPGFARITKAIQPLPQVNQTSEEQPHAQTDQAGLEQEQPLHGGPANQDEPQIGLASGKTRGVYLPVKDASGHITGITVAPDKPIRDDKGKVTLKYWWLSSKAQGGPEALLSCSVYLPLAGVTNPTEIVITEGQYKAFITAQLLGCPVISVPGTSSWERAGAISQALKLVATAAASSSSTPASSSMLQVTVAYDSELNEQTEKSRYALCEALYDAGLRVAVAEWDNLEGNLKGIDDLLQFGGVRAIRRNWYVPGLEGLRIDRLLSEPRLDETLSPASDKKVTLLRSPRGTGKTHWLTRQIRRWLQKGYQVLVIGHRVSLLAEAARRHALEFYLKYKEAYGEGESSSSSSKEAALAARANWQVIDGGGGGGGGSSTGNTGKAKSSPGSVVELGVPDGLAITFDSLPMLRPENLKEKLVVVIDESEQGLMHLAGSTIRDKRTRVLTMLNMLLGRADKVVFLDADISRLSYNFVTGRGWSQLPVALPREVEIIANEARPAPKTYVMYTKREALMEKLLDALARGQRVFIATNGRKTTKYIAKILARLYPDKKGWLINAHTSGLPAEKEKIEFINRTIQEYDYTIASPTLGTGVSIDYSEIDTVFLFGEASVNTHNDLLQQAARVRNPKSNQVHAWISPKKRRDLPTDVEEIVRQMTANPLETAAALGRRKEATKRLYTSGIEEQYIELLAEIEAARNTSWHDLAGNFWQAVAREGHEVTDSGDALTSTKSYKEIKSLQKWAQAELKEEYTDSIHTAPDITADEYRRLQMRNGISELERAAVRRYSIANFYGKVGEEITRALIEQDNESRMRAKITNFLALSDPEYAKTQDKRDMGEWYYLCVAQSQISNQDASNLSRTTSLARELFGLDTQTTGAATGQEKHGESGGQPVATLGKATEKEALLTEVDQLYREGKLMADWRHLYVKTMLRLAILEMARFIDPDTGQVDLSQSFTEVSLTRTDLAKWVASQANRRLLARLLGIYLSSEGSCLTRLVTSLLRQIGLECSVRQYRTGEVYIDPQTGQAKAVRERSYTVNPESYERVRELALARREQVEAKARAGHVSMGDEVTPWQQSA